MFHNHNISPTVYYIADHISRHDPSLIRSLQPTGGESNVRTTAAVLQSVSECERCLKDRITTSLLHVIAGDGDGVELGHVLRHQTYNHNSHSTQHITQLIITNSTALAVTTRNA